MTHKKRLTSHKKRTHSSRIWLTRQMNDPYVQKAHEDGYRSRAAYKLLDIQKKFSCIGKHHTVIDLGSAPGGWSQVLAHLIESGRIIALDITPVEPLPNVQIIQGDITDPAVLTQVESYYPLFDGVLSDMAAPACGIPSVDHMRIMGLLDIAWDFAKNHLAVNGFFIAKVLQGGTEHTLLQDLKQHFKKVVHFKPPSSRIESAELYVIAIGFKKIR